MSAMQSYQEVVLPPPQLVEAQPGTGQIAWYDPISYDYEMYAIPQMLPVVILQIPMEMLAMPVMIMESIQYQQETYFNSLAENNLGSVMTDPLLESPSVDQDYTHYEVNNTVVMEEVNMMYMAGNRRRYNTRSQANQQNHLEDVINGVVQDGRMGSSSRSGDIEAGERIGISISDIEEARKEVEDLRRQIEQSKEEYRKLQNNLELANAQVNNGSQELQPTDTQGSQSEGRRGRNKQRTKTQVRENVPSSELIAEIVAMSNNATRPVKYVQPIPKFAGDSARAFDFIRDYERAANINNWDDKRKAQIFESSLEGSAKIWYLGLRDGTDNWQELLELFKRRYFPEDREWSIYEQMVIAKQYFNENAIDFVNRVLKLRKEADCGVSNSRVISIIKRGLRQRDYMLSIINVTDDIDMIIRIFKEIDKRQNHNVHREVHNIRTNKQYVHLRKYGYQFNQKEPLKSNDRYRDRTNNNEQNEKYSKYYKVNNDKSTGKDDFRSYNCFNCDKPGHRYRECNFPKNKRKVQMNHDEYICKKMKHESRNQRPQKGNVETKVNPTINQTNPPNHPNRNPSSSQMMNQLIPELCEPNKTVVKPLKNWLIGSETVRLSSVQLDNIYDHNNKYEQVPMINILFNGQIVTALCDSGSSITAINFDFSRRKKLNLIPWQGTKFRSIDARSFRPKLMTCSNLVRIGHKEHKVDAVLLEELWPTVVLGADALFKFNIITLHTLKTISFMDDPLLEELINLGRFLQNKPINKNLTHEEFGNTEIMLQEGEITPNISYLFNYEQIHEEIPIQENSEILIPDLLPISEIKLEPLTKYIIKLRPTYTIEGRFLTIPNQGFCKNNIVVDPVIIDMQEDLTNQWLLQ